jgi:hypothetical protein
LEVIMPIQFVGPALQGASLVGRAIPVLQNLAGSAALGGLTSVVGTQLLKPKPTGKEKLYQAWGTIPDNIFSAKGGGFAYRNDNNQPSYKDAQGNIYDAVSGRLLYPAKVRPGGGGGGGGGGNAGYSVTGFRPIGGTPAERAQAAETSRVAQLTAQDPELQRYEAARLKAVAPGATAEQVQSAEDIGMQMWAKANPTLAAKVKPGQSGYDAIQGAMAGQAASQGFGYQMPQQMIFTPPPGVNTPQGLPAVESIGPSATYGAQGIDIDPEMQKKFQALLNQAKS